MIAVGMVATMIMIPQDHRRIAVWTTVTMDPGPPVTVAIVATHATVTIHPIFALFAVMGFLGTFIAGYYPR